MSVSHYIDKRWELDTRNQAGTSDVSRKKQFAYQIWKEDFERNQKREDGKKSEIKDTWTEVYQLIGFDNVFQGVWFQGVAQLAPQRDCHFSIIPIILSAFVSLVTIVAVYLKISKVRDLEERLKKDKLVSWGPQCCITACERFGLDFDFAAIEKSAAPGYNVLRDAFDKALVKSKRKSNILLLSLTIASILFAWLIGLIMCGHYV